MAAIVGVSPHTIRAWERRHGIVNPMRTHSRQRRYRREDVELLRDVKRAISVEGLSLKLAFQKVTGSQETEAPRTPAPAAPRKPRSWPLPSDEGVWHAVADALPQLVLVIDSRGTIREANAATARAFGVVRQRLEGRSFADLIDPFDRAKGVLIYRPRPRSVRDWELNLKTAGGVRLYSFQSWPVDEGETQSIALVGTEMFENVSLPRTGAGLEEVDRVAPGATAGDVFQTLVDQLPFGVVVATIGAEPRVVYANRRLGPALAVSAPIVAGTPVAELLPRGATAEAFGAALATGGRQTVRAVPAAGAGRAAKLVNVAFQPLLSSSRKIASMLILVEDVTAEAAERKHLEYLLAEQPFGAPATVAELARMGFTQLSKLLPGVEFVLMIRGHGSGQPAVVSSRALSGSAPGPVDDAYVEIIDRVLKGGRTVQLRLTVASRRSVITAIPVGARRRIGALAWRLPAERPLAAEQRNAAQAVAAGIAVAAELLHARAEASRRAEQLEQVINAAAVVREPSSRTGLGVRFLERLLETVKADGAAIGRIEAGDFVVEVAYAPFGAHAKPGDRFPLAGQFVSDSMRTGEVTETTVLGSPRLPKPVRRSLAQMSRGLSVPLVVEGEIPHVLTLVRKADIPFMAEDVLVVEALSGVALLAVAMEGAHGGADPPPATSGG